MTIIYTIDSNCIYSGELSITDPYAPVPLGVSEAPPKIQNDELARWIGNGWEVVSTIAPPEQIQAELEITNKVRIEKLWQAAHDYETAQISGSAIGLLAMGVMQGKPKCTSVQNWIKSIWVTYYTRKSTDSTDCDYSLVGECPHSVPELMLELGF